ncbi:malate dehydrogenase [Mycobacterium sherrisii]|uniref:Malate dehydrogenase n=1 Tax=Mycobacterium sherrisii TaxID=243061 RepID=A0A1E3SP86_9MYCO|nr:malate dehydrogenase [Mycobacterium sherrisii]MCV7029254.1 malate dehydrogenase [Mycobacterium sherrisii]MEC4764648.1 malate dehydrogenase [Mycobacterium sherrisii]ODR03961.1 malate dehydrogenase [Mycobacterium sherrisii]ORW77021.1 malate dehydrogenase [Mycobacterium sherrisii]
MTDQPGNTTTALVNGLGGASLGLGLTEILAPGKVAALAGVDDTPGARRVIRALGVRECGHGAALLGGPKSMVWTRVAGDVLDVAALAVGVARRKPGQRRRGTIAGIALSGIGALDLYAALRTTRNGAHGAA